MPIVMQEKQGTLEVRLSAQMFLAESGWRVRIDDGDHRGEPVEVFVAMHDSYPEQRAIEVVELVRRCVWQETNRAPCATAPLREFDPNA